MTVKIPRYLKSSYTTHIEKLIKDIDDECRSVVIQKVILDFTDTIFIEGEMTVLLSMLIFRAQDMGKECGFVGINGNLQATLSRNGFLSEFGIDNNELEDRYDNSIHLYVNDASAIDELEKYLETELFQNINWKSVKYKESERENITSAVHELAVNVKEHSGVNRVICCGQFYPQKKELHFALADNGVSIPENVIDKNGIIDKNDSQIIEWATCEGTSTKRIPQSGLGLYYIKEILLSVGDLTIISNNGFWWRQSKNYKNEEPYMYDMSAPLHGTFIHFSLKLDERMEPIRSVSNLLF